jgi:hypothetical protein
MAARKRESSHIGDLASNGRDLYVLPGVADATAAAMRSTCLRMLFLVSALGSRVVGRSDRADGIFGDV